MAVNRNIIDYNRYNAPFMHGTTVRQPDYMPEDRRYKEQYKKSSMQTKRQASRQVRKNRRRAFDMNPSYVAFLMIAVVAFMIVCVSYLRLQNDTVRRSENITMLQRELENITEQNTTAYNDVIDSVNLEEIRAKAMNELGMVYASEGRVVEYKSPTKSYVKQYNAIPQDGVLAKSKSVTE